jgi:hypothetical protein
MWTDDLEAFQARLDHVHTSLEQALFPIQGLLSRLSQCWNNYACVLLTDAVTTHRRTVAYPADFLLPSGVHQKAIVGA